MLLNFKSTPIILSKGIRPYFMLYNGGDPAISIAPDIFILLFIFSKTKTGTIDCIINVQPADDRDIISLRFLKSIILGEKWTSVEPMQGILSVKAENMDWIC